MVRFKYYFGLAVIALIVLFLGIFTCKKLSFIKAGDFRVTIRYKARKAEDLTVYWNRGHGFSAADHLTQRTDTLKSDYVFEIKQVKFITQLRIDPTDTLASAMIYSVTLSGSRTAYRIDHFDTVQNSGLIVTAGSDGSLLQRKPDNFDPYLIINIPSKNQVSSSVYSFTDILVIIGCCVITLILYFIMIRKKLWFTVLSSTPLNRQALFLFFILIISSYWSNDLFAYYLPPPSIENRRLTQKPNIDTLRKNARHYFDQMNNWFTDYFPFRQAFVHCNSVLKIGLFNITPMPSEVIIGKNFQLFSANSFLQDDYTGKRKFNKAELDALINCLREKKNYMTKHHMDFYLIMPPSKQDIYSDFMPEYYRAQKSDTKLSQQLQDRFTKDSDNYNINVIDTLCDYFKLHPEKKIFYQYDIHWSEWGAFKAYQVLMDRIYKDHPEYGKPLRENDVKIDTEYDDEADLAKLLVMNKIFRREKYRITPLKDDSIEETVIGDKFPLQFLYHNPKGKGRIVIFRDSYSEEWKWLIAHHFNESVFVWDPKVDAQLIEKYKPDIVLQENCEMLIFYLFYPLANAGS